MPYQFVPYTLLLMASAILTFALAVYGIKHRHTFGTNILGLCMAIGTLWSCANALEISALTLEHKLFWANLQYVAYSLGPVAWLLTSCQFTGRGHWLKRKNVLALFIIPVITILLVWTDPWWGFVRTGFHLDTAGPFLVLNKQYGPWFWVHVTQSYALNFLSIFLLGQALTNKSSIYKRQAFFLLAGITLVVFANLLYVLELSPVIGYDVTPIVFSLATGLMFWGIYSCDLFRLVPIAWEKVLEAMETAVVVVNNHGRVIDVNPAFCLMFKQKPDTSILGMSLEEVIPELPFVGFDALSKPDKHQEIHRRVQGEDRYYEVSVSEIRDHHASIQGRVMAIDDITQLKVTQRRLSMEQQEIAVAAERTRFTQDLHDNLGQILGFCSLQVQSIGRELDRGNDELARTYLRRLGEVLGEAQHEMRFYVHGMRSREYEQTSLTVLIHKELTRLKEHHDYDVYVDIAPCDFSVDTKIQLCGIVKEALNNIRKHSRASRVEVSLHLTTENWVFAVTDNGVGFDPTSTLTFGQGGSGLSIIAERAHLLGGDLQINSSPRNTTICVEFPRKGDPNHADYDC